MAWRAFRKNDWYPNLLGGEGNNENFSMLGDFPNMP